MPNTITMQQAREQNLPNADSIINSASYVYVSDTSMNWHAHRTFADAQKVFLDSYMISNWRPVIAEAQANEAWFNAGGTMGDDDEPSRHFIHHFVKNIFIENMKIASGFELSLKARLIQQGYIVFFIEKNGDQLDTLASAQRNRPIHISELLSVVDYTYTPQGCYLPGMQQKTLNFSTLTQKEEYRAVLGLMSREFDAIDHLRDMRNSIHLTVGDFSKNQGLNNLNEHFVAFTVRFINNYVVPFANNAAASGNVHSNHLLREI